MKNNYGKISTISIKKNMDKESKYYPLVMNYRKEVFNEFKRYCESRKINLDRSKKYKSLFPLKKPNGICKYYSHLNGFYSILDFIKNDGRFSLKSRKEFFERLAKINYRYCLAFYKINCINPYNFLKTSLHFSNIFYYLLIVHMPLGLQNKWVTIYELSRIIATDEDIELIIKYHLNYERKNFTGDIN